MAIVKGAEPFLYRGGANGVMLIHGFSGCPSEMRLLGNYLNQNCKMSVFTPRLSGHGTNEKEFANTRWVDWFRTVEDGYHILKSFCEKINIIGVSMGGLLALKLISEYPVEQCIIMGTPIFCDEPWMNTSRFSEFIGAHRTFYSKAFIADPVSKQYFINYHNIPRVCLLSFKDLVEHINVRIPSIQSNVAVLHSKYDGIVDYKSAEYIYNKLNCKGKSLYSFDCSEHYLPLSSIRHEVFSCVGNFLK